MIIEKLSDFMVFIESLPKEFSLSRGQSKGYSLLPTALRKTSSNIRKYSKSEIRYFLDEFKVNAYQYMTNPWDVNSDAEWMLYGQHYGIPTKLLDFTTSHITSLLFAVEKSFQSDPTENPIIYFLNPFALNLKNKNLNKIINISSDVSFDDCEGPVVIQGRKINPRVNAQKGLFVLFQDDDVSLEDSLDETILLKIEINREYSKKILSSLYAMGISFTHIYPELQSVSKDILMKKDIEFYLEDED